MMDDVFQPLVALTGASLDQLKLIACLVISYPLGSVYVRLPRSQPALKHIFSIALSSIFLILVLNLWLGTLQLLCSVLATYVIAASWQGRNMPWVVFAVVMGHLTFNHAYRAIYEIPLETFEITGPQMVLTMKLTTFAWNVLDGRRSAEELDKWQLKHRVTTMPSLLEFLGYAFYFPGILVGPYTEYATYASLIDGSLFETAGGRGENGGRFKRVPSGRKRVAYTRMIFGFVCLGLFVLFGAKYSYESILEDAWLQKSLLNRLFTIQVLGIVARTKYYSVWLLTEGASILTGLGFSGYTASGGSQWNGAANVNILSIEWPPNFKILLDSWNMKTNVWLRETMYKRVARKGKKPGFKSSMITFITSAFWHGIAGGYYLTFLLGGFITAAGRSCRANLRPLVLPPALVSSKPQSDSPRTEPHPSPPPTLVKKIYDFTGSLASLMILNFAVAPFIIGDFYDSIEMWRRMDWYGLWMVGGTLLFFSLGGKRWTTSIIQSRIRRAEKRREEGEKGVRVFIPENEEVRTPGPHVVPPVDLAVSAIEKT
ncbi:MBOAT-domain-containing protein [Ramaria rubella]|nr:MBOAT-domain-containing protein [Ramaria rubella]